MRLLFVLLLLGATCDSEPQTSGPLILPALTEAEQVADQETAATRIGAHRELPLTLPGAWTTDERNESVWRVEVRSSDAVALRLHFADFHLPSGSVTVFETDPEKRPTAERRYQGDGPGGDGEMWSDLIEGDSVIIEYRPGDGRPSQGPPPFRIDKISHLWRSLLDAF